MKEKYGLSPAMASLPDIQFYNDLPAAERVRASAALVRARLTGPVCPVCEARRKRTARKHRLKARQRAARLRKARFKDETKTFRDAHLKLPRKSKGKMRL